MSNIGLEIALRDSGIDMVRCPVGDKYVMEEMIKRGLSLGGEQSGHIIFSEHLFTGRRHRDGVERAPRDGGHRPRARGSGVRAGDLSSGAGQRPGAREEGSADGAGRRRRDEARRSALAGHGRLLVRYSGTEPLLRVMIEGKDQQEIQTWASEIVQDRQGAAGMNGLGPRELSVNVNKVATLRNSRRRDHPERDRRDPRVHRGGSAGHHRSPARRRAPHHVHGRSWISAAS